MYDKTFYADLKIGHDYELKALNRLLEKKNKKYSIDNKIKTNYDFIYGNSKYELKFDKELGENDKVFEDNNVKIAVEKKSFLYLAGTVLEFSGGLNGKGFVFNNPNASRTCGCGESFSL